MTSKKRRDARTVESSPGAARYCSSERTRPSLISSLQIAGHLILHATLWARVVLPTPEGPLTTINFGRATANVF